MTSPTFISLFSGGGGTDIGALAAGFEIAGGLEREAKIAEWYALNLGHQPIIDSVENVQPSQFDIAPDWLHASPPCQEFSRARTTAKLSAHPDLAAGIEVCRFIREWKAKFFTLENVQGYRHSPSLHAIENCLRECGYWYNRMTLNASDFGIPQSRVRLWVIAWRPDEVAPPILPLPSRRKVGWYDAIADLIPTLKESKLSPWHLRTFADHPIATSRLIANCNTSSAVVRSPHEPAMTMGKSKDAFRPKIYLVPNSSRVDPKEADKPCYTVTKCSVSASGSKVHELDGQTLATNARCAARFQSFPDSYQLPQNEILAGAIIGNAVPPRLAELIGKSFNF